RARHQNGRRLLRHGRDRRAPGQRGHPRRLRGVGLNGRTSVPGLIGLAIVVIALAIVAASASAATSRAEWVAQVDPICQVAYVAEKSADKTFHRQTKKAERQSKRGHHPSTAARKILFRFYHRTAQATQGMLNAISPIPAAPGDEATVASWLTGRQQSIDKL